MKVKERLIKYNGDVSEKELQLLRLKKTIEIELKDSEFRVKKLKKELNEMLDCDFKKIKIITECLYLLNTVYWKCGRKKGTKWSSLI